MSSTDGKGSSAWTLGIPRQLIARDGAGQRLSGQVMVLIRPACRFWNLVGISRARQNLRQQRVRIKRDPLHQLV